MATDLLNNDVEWEEDRTLAIAQLSTLLVEYTKKVTDGYSAVVHRQRVVLVVNVIAFSLAILVSSVLGQIIAITLTPLYSFLFMVVIAGVLLPIVPFLVLRVLFPQHKFFLRILASQKSQLGRLIQQSSGYLESGKLGEIQKLDLSIRLREAELVWTETRQFIERNDPGFRPG